MPASLNKGEIIGNLGSDVEMRYAPSGKPVTSFRVATNSRYTVNGERREETEWFSIVTWGKTAELCNQYLHKGSTVFVEGRFKTRSWDKDGVKHYRTELIANRVLFLDKVGQPSSGVSAGEGAEAPQDEGEITPEELPF